MSDNKENKTPENESKQPSDALDSPNTNQGDKKKKVKGFLKAAFTGAVVTGAIIGLKTALGATALTGAPLLATAALTSGLLLTGYKMINDYRNYVKDGPEEDALQTFTQYVANDWKHYAKTFAFKTGFAAVGAGLFLGAGEVLEHTGIGEKIGNIFNGAAEKLGGLFGFGKPEVEPEIIETAGLPEPVEAVEVPEIIEPVETTAESQDFSIVDTSAVELVLQPESDVTDTDITADEDTIVEEIIYDNEIDRMIAIMEVSDLDCTGDEILEGLKNGEAWAIESAAVGGLNGLYGIPCVETDIVVALMEQAAESGNQNAMINMAYFQYHGLYGVEMNQDAALDVICELGRSWVGGEHLLPLEEIVETVEFTETITEVSSYEYEYNTESNYAVATQPMTFNIIGECDVTDNNSATCTLDKDTIGPGESMVYNMPNGISHEFGLSSDAAPRSAEIFQTEKLIQAINVQGVSL